MSQAEAGNTHHGQGQEGYTGKNILVEIQEELAAITPEEIAKWEPKDEMEEGEVEIGVLSEAGQRLRTLMHQKKLEVSRCLVELEFGPESEENAQLAIKANRLAGKLGLVHAMYEMQLQEEGNYWALNSKNFRGVGLNQGWQIVAAPQESIEDRLNDGLPPGVQVVSVNLHRKPAGDQDGEPSETHNHQAHGSHTTTTDAGDGDGSRHEGSPVGGAGNFPDAEHVGGGASLED
ncbi:MAG: hypothetical protein WC045_01065 [Patescibacteria group bacterium]